MYFPSKGIFNKGEYWRAVIFVKKFKISPTNDFLVNITKQCYSKSQKSMEWHPLCFSTKHCIFLSLWCLICKLRTILVLKYFDSLIVFWSLLNFVAKSNKIALCLNLMALTLINIKHNCQNLVWKTFSNSFCFFLYFRDL